MARLLLVDDDEALLELTAEACGLLGYPALTARSGAEALELLKASPELGLMISDLKLNGTMDGFALADAARDLQPGLPVMFVSGYGSYAERPEGMTEARILRKPVGMAVLKEALADHLGPA